MRKITADYVFPAISAPVKNGVVVIDDAGKILTIDTGEKFSNDELEKYEGIICPGFINAHCHSELSHLKGQIPEKTGLTGFVKEIVALRDKFSKEEIEAAVADAEREMIANGIVAVGDICNGNDSFRQKEKGKLRYHAFVEVFDLNSELTLAAFGKGKQVYEQVPIINKNTRSITPHAPYSVTPELFKKAIEFTAKDGKLLSIHVSESQDENDLFISKTGGWINHFKDWNINMSFFNQTGKTSFQSILGYLNTENKALFVHNTILTKEDFEAVKKTELEAWFCLCPNANLYIENVLPDIDLIASETNNICIGTDSLASNHQLSVLEEMKIISKNFPKIPLEKLIQWATLNGASFFNYEDFGSIKPGKKPSLNLITNIDAELRLTASSAVVKIV